MISAFKHIRLSGSNLTPVQGTAWDGSSQLRLGLGGSGLAYYSELTGISGYLQGLINTATADVNSINVTGYNAAGNLAITGLDGVKLSFNTATNTIEVNGNSGYFQALSTKINTDLATTGSTLYNLLTGFSGVLSTNFVSTGNFTALSGYVTGSFAALSGSLTALSGYVNSQDIVFSGQIALTGSTLDTKITNYSGWASATYVAKSSNQIFTKTLTVGSDAYAVIYPVPFPYNTIPKVLATLEVDQNSDVMYNLSIRSITSGGYTGLLSDNILEAGAKIHTFASTQA
jgi:hypothetical protein